VHHRLVLLGPPAAGKGTQAELLKERFGFLVPSVGAMLREQKAAGTPAGLRAAGFFERGLLVPDDITSQVVSHWLAAHHGPWAFDGYPRTLSQADAFDSMLRDQHAAVDLALLLVVDEPLIRDRVAHRLLCQACGRVFRVGLHVSFPSDPCPRCGGILGRRSDDNLDTLADRLAEYRTKTGPLISSYEARGILRRIDGNRPVETVFADFSAAIEAVPAKGS
jgi:adenylate kinase